MLACWKRVEAVLPYLAEQETILALITHPLTLLSFSVSSFARRIYGNKMHYMLLCWL